LQSRRWFFFARRAGFAAACLVSTLAGAAFVFVLVTPRFAPLLRTHDLLGMLGLMVLPAASVWAVRRDRAAARAETNSRPM